MPESYHVIDKSNKAIDPHKDTPVFWKYSGKKSGSIIIPPFISRKKKEHGAESQPSSIDKLETKIFPNLISDSTATKFFYYNAQDIAH